MQSRGLEDINFNEDFEETIARNLKEEFENETEGELKFNILLISASNSFNLLFLSSFLASI